MGNNSWDGGRTEAKARAEGLALLSRMHGKGWRLRVWENLGWHYCVWNGPVSVSPLFGYPDHRVRYSCLLGKGGAGFAFWSTNGEPALLDPNKAAAREVENARRVIDGYVLIVERGERIVNAKERHGVNAKARPLVAHGEGRGAGRRQGTQEGVRRLR